VVRREGALDFSRRADQRNLGIEMTRSGHRPIDDD
jgi:hypothetical protein